jgi:succinyl-diaminopimelate desuccinylase
VTALSGAVREIVGRQVQLVASPGTYDQKHFKRIAGIDDCVAYGPGCLDLAHQPDEWVGIDDLVTSTKVLAAAILRLVGGASAPGRAGEP